MKSRVFAVLAALVLLCCALVYGAEKGWANERAQVESTYATLEKQLETRVETACNILTVARRHMAESDALIAAVEKDKTVLSGSAPLAEKAQANQAFTADAQKLLEALGRLESVKSDNRDLMYVNGLLPQMLSESEAYTAQSEYNTAAADFNARLDNSFLSGSIAKFLGVQKCEVFYPAAE